MRNAEGRKAVEWREQRERTVRVTRKMVFQREVAAVIRVFHDLLLVCHSRPTKELYQA